MSIKHFHKKQHKYILTIIIFVFIVPILIPNLSKASFNVKRNFLGGENNENYYYNHSILNPIILSYQNSLRSQGGDDFIISENTIKTQNTPIINTREKEKSDIKNTRDKIVTYIVQNGDNVSKIAKNFNISQNTIIWENNIKNGIIRPGQKLSILPVNGLKYKIKKGDTLAKIANKYQAVEEEIFDFNDLESDTLKIGELLIIPNGKKKISTTKKRSSSKSNSWKGHYFVPTKKVRYTKTDYGWLTHPAPGSIRTQGLHGKNSIDMGAPIGTPILAAASGTVIKSYYGGWGGGYGNHIKIQHPNGVVTLYAHLSKNKVWKGQKVVKGQVIGLMGSTGRSTGSHLHFEVRGAKNPF